MATMLILLMKIVNSITWIQNHILQIHDEYNKLRRISDEIGDDPNAEKAPELDDDPNFFDMGDCND